MTNYRMLIVLALAGGCVADVESADPDALGLVNEDATGGDDDEGPILLVQRLDGEIEPIRVSTHRGQKAVDDMLFGPVDDDGTVLTLSDDDTDNRWPQGVVPYAICTSSNTWPTGCGSGNHFESGEVDNILDAISEIEARVPGVRFEPMTSAPNLGIHYVSIAREEEETSTSYSELGYRGLPGSPQITHQHVWLGHDVSVEVIRHELGHTLGLIHENQRADRDEYVAVIEENVDGPAIAFSLWEGDTRLTPYDYQSMMHYNNDTFCMRPSQSEPCTPQDVVYYDGNEYVEAFTGDTLIPLQDTNPLTASVETELGSMWMSRHDINGLSLMYPPPAGEGHPFDNFGSALVLADFDQDGYDDLAVGIPDDDLQLPFMTPLTDNGKVMVFKGTEYGLIPWIELSVLSTGTMPADDDRFGAALATGDFNGDGFPDLVVGAPGRGYGTGRPGAAYMFMGGQHPYANLQVGAPDCGAPCSADSRYTPLEFVGPDLRPTEPVKPDGGAFGQALATGDLDGDGVDEIAVGAPQSNGSGGVYVFFTAFSAAPKPTVTSPDKLLAGEDPDGFPGSEFGSAIAIANLDADGEGEILVGSPGTDSVHVFTGATPTFVTELRTDGHAGDRFGESIAIGRFVAQLGRQFVVGAPARTVGGQLEAGALSMWNGRSMARIQTVESPLEQADARFGAALAVDDHAFSLVLEGSPQPLEDLFVGAPGYDGGAGRVLVLLSQGEQLDVVYEVPAPELAPVGFGSALAVGSVKDAAFESFFPWPDPARLYASAPLGTYQLPSGALGPSAGFVHGYVHDELLGLMPRELVVQERQSPFAADD